MGRRRASSTSGYSRPIDKEATKEARTRHARGVAILRALFRWTSEDAAAAKKHRRQTQGAGPTAGLPASRRGAKPHAPEHHQRHWTRADRRRAARAQRKARRANRV